MQTFAHCMYRIIYVMRILKKHIIKIFICEEQYCLKGRKIIDFILSLLKMYGVLCNKTVS